MLCSLLKIWNTYSIANALFPSYGKMYSTPTDQPVAMMMSYSQREVTIVNQKDYVPCFTTEVASKFNAPVITISPNMYKYNTGLFEHYIFYDENANIKLPPSVQLNKTETTLTKKIERFSSKNMTVGPFVKTIIDKHIGSTTLTTKKKIDVLVKDIVRQERRKKLYKNLKLRTLKTSLKKEIHSLVKIILTSHRNHIVTRAKINNILSIVKNKKGSKKAGRVIKHIVQSIVKMNALNAVTTKKIDSVMSLARSYPKKVAEKKIKHVIQSIIRTKTNQALAKHTITKMVNYVRSHSGKLSEKAIEFKLKRMVNNIINTTVRTIVPLDKVIKIVYTIKKTDSKRAVENNIKNIIHNIRVDKEKEEADVDDCPICKCNFKKPKHFVKVIPIKRKDNSFASQVLKVAKRTKAKKAVKTTPINIIVPISRSTNVPKSKTVKASVPKVVKAKKAKIVNAKVTKAKKAKIVNAKVTKAKAKIVKPKVVKAKKAKIVKPKVVKAKVAKSKVVKSKIVKPKVVKAKAKKAKVVKSKVVKSKVVKSKVVKSKVVNSNVKVSKKKVKMWRLSKKIKSIAKQLTKLKKLDNILKKRENNLKMSLKSVETKPKFDKIVNKLKIVNRRMNVLKKKVAKLNVNKFISSQKKFNVTPKGVQAKEVCKQLGAKGNVLKGCLQDMRLAKNPTIVITAVKQSMNAVKKVKSANLIQKRTGIAPSRTCTANGDPHFTNFNGDYFHVQLPLIYTFAKSSDGLFEVQVKQTGSTGPGVPSYVRDVMIRYDGQVYHRNFNKDGFIVNGDNSQVTVTVPGSYQGEMLGICGTNGVSPGASNFKLPNGNMADVNYGKKDWALAGYGGPNTKLSKWQLSWRPSIDQCMFSKQECVQNVKDIVQNEKNRFISTPWGRVDTQAMK